MSSNRRLYHTLRIVFLLSLESHWSILCWQRAHTHTLVPFHLWLGIKGKGCLCGSRTYTSFWPSPTNKENTTTFLFFRSKLKRHPCWTKTHFLLHKFSWKFYPLFDSGHFNLRFSSVPVAEKWWTKTCLLGGGHSTTYLFLVNINKCTEFWSWLEF